MPAKWTPEVHAPFHLIRRGRFGKNLVGVSNLEPICLTHLDVFYKFVCVCLEDFKWFFIKGTVHNKQLTRKKLINAHGSLLVKTFRLRCEDAGWSEPFPKEGDKQAMLTQSVHQLIWYLHCEFPRDVWPEFLAWCDPWNFQLERTVCETHSIWDIISPTFIKALLKAYTSSTSNWFTIRKCRPAAFCLKSDCSWTNLVIVALRYQLFQLSARQMYTGDNVVPRLKNSRLPEKSFRSKRIYLTNPFQGLPGHNTHKFYSYQVSLEVRVSNGLISDTLKFSFDELVYTIASRNTKC